MSIGKGIVRNSKVIRVDGRCDELMKKCFPRYKSAHARSVKLSEVLEEMLYGKKPR